MKKLLPLLLILCAIFANAQDLTQIGKAKLFTLGGGISANSVYYNGDGQRDPFTYVLNGNLNLNISGIYNIPISFAYSNQDFNYSQPFKFNRLSLNPSYKWLTAHIGDVSMTFSPYTLSGHQFTGLGFDATPTANLKLSAMYGRLVRPNEYDPEDPQAVPAYKRIGYGLKSAYDFEKFSLGLTFFAAKDEENSVENPFPVETAVSPQDNLVISVDGKVKLFGSAILNVEYATSGITDDTRASGSPENGGPVGLLYKGNATTRYYNAFNAQLSTSVGNGSVGATYERIDPGYQTLGAYFFNNDLENIAVNASQSIFDSAVNISVNAGLQRDNLDKAKTSELQRVVTAVNVSVRATEKLNINASYSNFQSVTNIRDQFDYINAVTPFDNIDTLNFRQLSRNATLNLTYAIAKSKERVQNASINLSMQDTEDLQEQFLSGTQTTVGATTFYNTGGNYSINFVPIDLSVTAGVNASFNKTLETSNNTLGPTVAISKLFFDKKLRSSFAASYNRSSADGELQNTILNFRANAGYQLFKKHQFNLSLLSLFRNNATAATNNLANDFTATLGYNYSFTVGKLPSIRLGERDPRESSSGLTETQFRSDGTIYQGNANELDTQISDAKDRDAFSFVPPVVKEKVDGAKLTMLDLKTAKEKDLRDAAIEYLTEVDDYNAFAKAYDQAILIAVRRLTPDAMYLDDTIEKEFAIAGAKVQAHQYKGIPLADVPDKTSESYKDYKIYHDAFEIKREKLINHRYMLERIAKIRSMRDLKVDKQLKQFRKELAAKVYEAYGNIAKNPTSLSKVLTVDLILYYKNLATKFADKEEYSIKYLSKIKN